MYSVDVRQRLPELLELEGLAAVFQRVGTVEVLDNARFEESVLPIYKLSVGSRAEDAPVLVISGGVHGLERIGTQVVLSILRSVVELMDWDEVINHQLEQIRLVFIPLVNPVGMLLKRRANPYRVDLMRNAPIEADKRASFLVGGHRFSKYLYWYRGEAEAEMELETRALCRAIREEIFGSKVALSIDCHSGFGSVDRLWFPYAKTRDPFPGLPELYALKLLLDRTYPNHFYRIEPQAKHYTTHGDIWDHMYDEYNKAREGIYLPLCLEMGSWIWVRKNPSQIISALGPFNPIIPQREARILRRHLTLFDFLLRAVNSPQPWVGLDAVTRLNYESQAREFWYRGRR